MGGVDRIPNIAAPRRRWVWVALVLLAAIQTSCVLLPVRIASGVSGQVVDAVTGQPVAGALVVVRFEGHYDDILPDREVLGHRETHTDGSGRFLVGRLVRPGVSAWPMYETEARVEAVMHDDYLCGQPRADRYSSEVLVSLDPAASPAQRQSSCRPVAARRGEASEYMTAWRAMFPEDEPSRDAVTARQLDRMLRARAALGFGDNCEGPAFDLSLAPDGHRAAFVVAGDDRSEIRVIELRGPRTGKAETVAAAGESEQRLAWTSPGDLVLWEPSPNANLSVSPSEFSHGRFERVWSAPSPAARAPAPGEGSAEQDAPMLDPEDLNDEGDVRWRGRTFALERSVDPETGLSNDELRVYRPDGTDYRVALPGEPCGAPGRFGRPHYRIAADGRTSLDLRFVDGGCHVVRTDLDDGDWSVLDGADSPGYCSSSRRVQAAQFTTALRGYSRDLSAAVSEAGGDPSAAYALRIDAAGKTQLDTRDFEGEPVTVDVSPFPIRGPLRRIEVSVFGSGSTPHTGGAEAPAIQPL